MPAYFYDPYRYRAHKMKGGTFQSYADKKYLPLTDDQLMKHLNGEQLVGLYPLLQDNSSWFIAADFDEVNWIADSKKFMDCCKARNIPAYLERSRSGKGGHVWVFFSQAYPAFKSRRIFLSLLTESGVISAFDKNSSFDRLFPNQDTLSGKGLGNLIAMPLHKPALDKGNSCFIDPETLIPFPDQWSFLSGIEKVNVRLLEEIYNAVSADGNSKVKNIAPVSSGELIVSLDNALRLNRSSIPLTPITFLKEGLNFTNSVFIIKKKTGKILKDVHNGLKIYKAAILFSLFSEMLPGPSRNYLFPALLTIVFNNDKRKCLISKFTVCNKLPLNIDIK
ncbi:MAG TPA: hypothetical protein PLL71_01970 [Agriterribacter sp.]|nr:hypothetical protein [Agriterribacter sp.]HRQ50089.1 hypothetical protein [Agriterribacter sp.]